MKKRKLLLSSILMLMSVGIAQGQTVYTYVQQNGTPIAKDGLAGFDLSSSPSVEFVDGKAVMTIGNNTVATLPMQSGGQLVVEFEAPTATELTDLTVNELTVGTTDAGLGTLYSPFQLKLVEKYQGDRVYGPSYDKDLNAIECNSQTEVIRDMIIPVGTGLLLKNVFDMKFEITAEQPDDVESDLSGSAIKIPKSDVELGDGEVIFTLGHEKTTNKFRFFEYTGEYLNAAKAYLVAETLNSTGAKYISLNFDEDTSGVEDINENLTDEGVRKYIEAGHVVILKDGKKFNANGQKLK